MRLTRFGFNGLLFYVVMLAGFFAAPYSNLFFLLLGFLTVLGGIGLVGARRNLSGVTAALAELPPVPAGEGVRLPVHVSAPAPARFQVGMQLRLAGGPRLAGRVDLLDGGATLALRATALPRGCHRIEGAWLESSHPLGLVRVTREVEAPAELVVYPAPRELREGRTAAAALDELLGRSDPGGGDLQPTSLRDHREGDGVHRVHWRASARRARLVVQEWEGGSGQGLEVVLDRRCGSDELEDALSTISSMVHLARTNKETLLIHSQDLSATFGPGQLPWSEALRFLARADVLPEDGPAPPPTSPVVARLPLALAGRATEGPR